MRSRRVPVIEGRARRWRRQSRCGGCQRYAGGMLRRNSRGSSDPRTTRRHGHSLCVDRNRGSDSGTAISSWLSPAAAHVGKDCEEESQTRRRCMRLLYIAGPGRSGSVLDGGKAREREDDHHGESDCGEEPVQRHPGQLRRRDLLENAEEWMCGCPAVGRFRTR